MSDTAGSRTDGTVDQLLHEAGLDNDAVLRPALLELRGLAAGQPEASAAVAALMAPPAGRAVPAGQTAATTRLAAVPDATPGRHFAAAPEPEAADQPATVSPAAPTDELAARRRARRRITLTTLTVAASLAAGGAVAVASDQGIRDSIGQLHHAVTSFVATAGGGPAPAPVETPAPAPAQPGSPASVPGETASTPPAAPTPETGNSQAPKHTPTPTHPGDLPLPDLPVPGNPLPENVTPGAPGGPLNGEGQPPTLPLPATAPVPVPSVHP
ncbi:hypothetical protein [Arthrobacter sp. BE255]|uniref:hypothetical protein n=1 Tax=Arthrobacter sp. BE255 TaxID=2817721 RepID=UPI00286169DA|nr:hypothetical protein [Arthrobacter sp. BE255]MDR7159494.1 hypothetical protein [Arthrobacter sp. BE255]